MIRVVHLITLLEMGGAQGNTLYTCEHLDSRKFEAHLWSGTGAYWDREAQGKFPGKIRFFSSLVRPINPVADFFAVISLWRALRRLRPDIVHTHSSKAGIVGRIAARLAGVPIIIHTFHGFGFNPLQKPWIRWLFIKLERFTARLSTALIFVSQSNMVTARQNQIGEAARYVLIRSGIPISEVRKEAQFSNPTRIKAELGLPPGGRLVTTIGPFKPQKNLSDFVAVAREVSSQVPNAYFLLIGDGAQRSTLEKQIKTCGLEGRVLLPGWRRDVPGILAISEAFVLTSLWEGLPRAMVEALALGVPAVCYNTDGVADLMEKGGGIPVVPGKTGDMASALSRILNDRRFATDLGGRGRALITQEFDIDQMVKQQEDLYIKLLDGEGVKT